MTVKSRYDDGIATYRTFGGKRYRRAYTNDTKRDAEKDANWAISYIPKRCEGCLPSSL